MHSFSISCFFFFFVFGQSSYHVSFSLRYTLKNLNLVFRSLNLKTIIPSRELITVRSNILQFKSKSKASNIKETTQVD